MRASAPIAVNSVAPSRHGRKSGSRADDIERTRTKSAIGTAFFTTRSLDYFFDPEVSDVEYRRRRGWFDRLTDRQSGQKGTLLYDNGRTRTKCYFEDAPHGVTGTGVPTPTEGPPDGAWARATGRGAGPAGLPTGLQTTSCAGCPGQPQERVRIRTNLGCITILSR